MAPWSLLVDECYVVALISGKQHSRRDLRLLSWCLSGVFQDVTSFSLVEAHCHFIGTYCLYLQSQGVCQASSKESSLLAACSWRSLTLK